MADSKTVTVTMRLDQAQCIISALGYVIERCNEHYRVIAQQPAVKLACRLAADRALEAMEVVAAAVRKSEEGAREVGRPASVQCAACGRTVAADEPMPAAPQAGAVSPGVAGAA